MEGTGNRRMKRACVLCIVLKQLVSIIRCCVVFSFWEDSKYYFFTDITFYAPILIAGTIFSAIQLYSLLRELQEDLIWTRRWFCRIFTLYCLTFWLYLYGEMIMLHLLYIFCAVYPYGQILDSLDVILNLVIQALIMKLLFRTVSNGSCGYSISYSQSNAMNQDAVWDHPVTPFTFYTNSHTQSGFQNQSEVFSVSQNDTRVSNMERDTSPQSDMDTQSCCNKRIAFIFGVFFYIIFALDFIFLIYHMALSGNVFIKTYCKYRH